MLLHSFSNDQIISRIQTLTRRERKATLLVLLHLNEVERRKLHLALGYPSLFAFCTERLGYSESDAGRRIAAARCVARFPEVYGLLETNAVTLVTISRVASLLSPGNKDELLARVCGRTQAEVDAIVSEYRPRAALPRDKVEVIVSRPAVPATAPSLLPASGPEAPPAPGVSQSHACSAEAPGALAPDACEKSDYSHSGSAPVSGVDRQADNAAPPERHVKFSFVVDEAFKTKFDRVRSLAAHRLPARASYEDIFELLMDEFLEREDPRARRERREKRANVAEKGQAAPGVGAASANARYIPQAVRDDVFQRDGGCCTFVGRDGRRCGSAHMLQVDHILPVALGGISTRDNLRLLCAHHNRFEAKRMMGRQRCSARVVVSGARKRETAGTQPR